MNIGTLNIEIAANIARLKADMDAAKQAVGTAMKDIEQAVGFAKTAFIGLVGIGSVGAFKGMIDSAIEGRARLYQLSIQTGISVEALGAMAKVGKYTGTSIDEIAAVSNKLSKALYVQNEDSKGAAQAIKALGLNFDAFKALKADEQMLALAKAMDVFQDGSGKSATAMILLGKSGATLLPYLKELAEQNALVGKVSTESAMQAHEYEKSLKQLSAAGDAWKRELVDAALPAMADLVKFFAEARKEAGLLQGVLITVGAGFARAFGVDEAGSFMGKAKATSAEIERVTNLMVGLSNVLEREPGNETARRRYENLRGTLRGLQADAVTAGDKLKAFAGEPQAKGPTAAKQELKFSALEKTAAGPLKDLADGYEALMQKLRTKIDLDRQEIALGRQLTDGEKLQIDVYSEVEKNYQKLSVAKMLNIDETLQMALALGNERRAQEENLKSMKELDLQQRVSLQETFMRARALEDELKLMQEQVQQYGLTAEELNAVTSARMRDAAAQLDWKAQFNGNSEFLETQAQLYRDQAEALRGMADARDMLAAKEARQANDPLAGANRAVREYLLDVKRAGDATYGAVANSIKGLDDLTVTALMGGDAKSAAKAWVNGILSEVYRLKVVKPLFAALFGKDALGGGGSDGIAGLIASLFGGGGGGGSFGGAGSGGDGYAGFAKGDVFDRATPFRFAAGGAFKNGIMGEAGPEAVMPLTRGADGKLGVAAQGGGSRQVMVNVINNGAPVQARSSQRETSEGTVIELVLDAVAADMAGGGKVHDATQRRFGLNPGGSTPRY